MKSIVRCLIIMCLVGGGLLRSPLAVEAEHGLTLNRVTVSDQQNKQAFLYQESHALVIGVSNYRDWPNLPGVRRDVQEVKVALEMHGFNVVIKMDLDEIGLEKAFNAFINRYGQDPENRLLFYFAGHGHTVRMSYGEEIGYIVPVDAPLPERDLPVFQSKAVDMQRIEYYAVRIQSKHALFVFDACFSGSLFALSRAAPEIIGYKTVQPVRQFITSGSADETVPDESIFRKQFVRALQGEADSNQDGYVTGTELGEFLQTTVVNYSHNAQHPQYGKIRNPHLDKGDFVFKLLGKPEAVISITLPGPGQPLIPSSEFTPPIKKGMSRSTKVTLGLGAVAALGGGIALVAGGGGDANGGGSDDNSGMCGGVEVEGYCWYLGSAGASCDDVCVSHGGYHDATKFYAGSEGSASNCGRVLDALEASGGVVFSMEWPNEPFYGIGCSVLVYNNSIGRYWYHTPPTTSQAFDFTFLRACACIN